MLAALSTSPQSFLQPTSSLHAAAVLATKRFLDPLADAVHSVQEARRHEAHRKRKRGDHQAGAGEPILQLRQVYTEGFKIGQVWEQAKRILDAAGLEIERELQYANDVGGAHGGPKPNSPQQTTDGKSRRVEFEDGNSEIGLSDDTGEEDMVLGSEGSLGTREDQQLADNLEEGDLELEAIDKDDSGDGNGLHSSDNDVTDTFVADRNGLNDGFFSIDDFNKQSQFLEQRDVLGESDGAASDEEDFDWSINPLNSATANASTGGEKADDTSNGFDDESEDGGPTFGNTDLNASSDEDYDANGALDVEAALPSLDNTNDIKYADFFEPPPKPANKSKKRRPLPKTQPQVSTDSPSDLEADMQRAMSDVRRDLFEDEEEVSSESEDDNDRGILPTTNLSTHEKQRLKIAKEIARLEAANVSKRDWTLSGEARAADRPVNSLIEEDLEFERTGKPVPVITAEVSEEIEELIKRRILAKEFDEVIRRRPDAVGAAHNARRGRVDLDDNRPQQSLADIYESEHLAKTDPNYKDPRSEKLTREHAEIDRLWKDVSAKLDTLSNLNYKPKRPEASVSVVTDAPTITMEDVRPTADVTGADGSRLAPQEVYNPAHDTTIKNSEEVMRRGGAAIAKEEMSRGEKLRRRRREKERRKKGAAVREAKNREKAGKGQGKQDILNELRKGDVKVIGSKGDVTDVQGRKVKGGITGIRRNGAGDEGRRVTSLKL